MDPSILGMDPRFWVWIIDFGYGSLDFGSGSLDFGYESSILGMDPSILGMDPSISPSGNEDVQLFNPGGCGSKDQDPGSWEVPAPCADVSGCGLPVLSWHP